MLLRTLIINVEPNQTELILKINETNLHIFIQTQTENILLNSNLNIQDSLMQKNE